MTVPISEWGADHWSTFAYLETVCVDHDGSPSLNRMRCDPNRHPEFVYWMPMTGEAQDGSQSPTRLQGGKELPNHDDWDCVEDLVREGLLEDVGWPMTPKFRLTDRGYEVAGQLRRHKAEGGAFAGFQVAAEAPRD